MATKRMFSYDVINTDMFLDLMPESQSLYFILGLMADDDGFVGSPRSIARYHGCTKTNIDELVEAGYLIKFDDGVVVLTHWKLMNTIQKDRYHPTIYQEHFRALVQDKKIYKIIPKNSCLQSVTNMDTSCEHSEHRDLDLDIGLDLDLDIGLDKDLDECIYDPNKILKISVG